MKSHGSLSKWNDDRGFGFIAPAQPGAEIFVHISAFPRDGVRPSVGELVSFEIEVGGDGRQRAVRIQRPGANAKPARAHATRSAPRKSGALSALMGVLMVGALGAYGISAFNSRQSARPASLSAPAARGAPAVVDAYRCDGRAHCSQMTSCAEATFFITHCPNTQMDGDGDGVPCEQQWCR
jgi:cold shock CspA family protein